MIISTPLVALIVISTAVGVAILIAASFLYGFNGTLTRTIAKMLILIAVEIAFAIFADCLLTTRPAWFSAVKVIGRLIEASGITYFFVCLIRMKRGIAAEPEITAQHSVKRLSGSVTTRSTSFDVPPSRPHPP